MTCAKLVNKNTATSQAKALVLRGKYNIAESLKIAHNLPKFVAGQIKYLLLGKNHTKWSYADIQQTVAISSASH